MSEIRRFVKVCYIVQEAVIKTIPKKKKCKKAEWLSEEASQIAEKRRNAKGRRKKERYGVTSLSQPTTPSSVPTSTMRAKRQNGHLRSPYE